MASSFNLIRDSRVFFTTNVDNFGVVNSTGFLSGAYGTGNTWEIQVQDGFSFSQNTTTETVTLNEAGDTPNRGQRNFNTALEAVDFSFSTYIRPRDAGDVVDAEEGILWNAMFSAAPIPAVSLSGVAVAGTTGQFTCSTASLVAGAQVTISGINTGTAGAVANGTYFIIGTPTSTSFTLGATATSTSGIATTAGAVPGLIFTLVPPAASKLNAWQPQRNSAVCTLENSGKHQLQQFGLIIVLGGTTFVIDNCVMDSATIDFGLDAIASIAWAGKGGTLRQLNNSPVLINNTTSGVVTFTPTSSPLVSPTIAGTTGQFTCSTTSLVVGGTVSISGTNTSFAGIAGTTGLVTSTLASPTVTGTSGQFSCTATSLQLGAQVVISGTAGTAGAVTNGTYFIIATNGTTTFTLGASAASTTGIATALISLAGLTFTYTPVTPSFIPSAISLASVVADVTSGSFTAGSAPATPLVVGGTVVISGTLGTAGTAGTAGSVATGNYFIVSVTPGTNTFSLSSTIGGAPIASTSGLLPGLTFSYTAPPTQLASIGNNTGTTPAATYYIIATNGTTTFTLGATPTSTTGITTTVGPLTGLTISYGAPGSVVGTANWKNITAPYLANKLSTVVLDTAIGAGGTAYTVAITGGSLTFANNVSYLTPANLGVVNTPIVYFTGTRAISGTMNAYLRTGALQTAGLLKSLLEGSATTVDPAFYMKLSIGGNPTAVCRVDVEMPAVMLTIPTVATEQVVSTTISFTAQGSASNAFDIEQLNEVSVTYIAPQV